LKKLIGGNYDRSTGIRYFGNIFIIIGHWWNVFLRYDHDPTCIYQTTSRYFALWNHPEALPLAIVFLLFLFGWLILMPRINHHRDEQLAGNKVAISKFNRLHKFSVVLNSLQLTTVSVVFIRLII
jgi:hypothetical protein